MLGLDQSFGVAAITLRRPVCIVPGKEVRIATREGDGVKSMTRG